MIRENELPYGVARDSWVAARNNELTKIVKGRLDQRIIYKPFNIEQVTETEDGYDISGTYGTEAFQEHVTFDQFIGNTSIERKTGLA